MSLRQLPSVRYIYWAKEQTPGNGIWSDNFSGAPYFIVGMQISQEGVREWEKSLEAMCHPLITLSSLPLSSKRHNLLAPLYLASSHTTLDIHFKQSSLGRKHYGSIKWLAPSPSYSGDSFRGKFFLSGRINNRWSNIKS